MLRVEKTVFLSYRRTNYPWAHNIYDNLKHEGYDVFIDYAGIGSGAFEPVILGNIKARAHFLVVLTPSSLDRCDEPGDWFRREIETALDMKRNIIPILLEGFDFSEPKIAGQLTGKLAELRKYSGLIIPLTYFDEAMVRLRDRFLNVEVGAILHEASLSAKQAAAEQKVVADAQPKVTEEELTAQHWFERGFAANDLEEQLRCYGQAIHLRPNNADALYNRGNTWSDRGMLNAALEDYTEAIRIKPNLADAFYRRGNLHYWKNDLDKALKDFEETIRLKPDHVAALQSLKKIRNEQSGSANRWLQSIFDWLRSFFDALTGGFNK